MIRKLIFFAFILISFCVEAQVGFIENKGQVVDQFFKPNSRVKFLLNQRGMNVLLNKDGFSYQAIEDCGKIEIPNIKESMMDIRSTPSYDIRTHRVDIQFLNSNPHCKIIPSDANESTSNYYTSGTGEKGVLGVRKFQKIVYQELYDGIDLEFKVNQQLQFEYDFIIHAGADMSQIQMQYDGQNEIALLEDAISLTLDFDVLKEKIPKAFLLDSKSSVSVSYALNQNIVSFRAEPFFQETLVIDPTPNLVYASYFGGTSLDSFADIEIDNNGNYFILGITMSTANIATIGSHQELLGSEEMFDLFIQKWSPTDNLLWSSYFGGEKNEFVGNLQLHNGQNPVICGSTLSLNQISTSGANQLNNAGMLDSFLAYFQSDGQISWSTYFGGNHDDNLAAILIHNDTIIGVGNTSSTNLSLSPNAIKGVLTGSTDGFILKWNMNGDLYYSTLFGGDASDGIFNLIVDVNDDLFLVGSTGSQQNFSFNAFQPDYGGGMTDAFFCKLNLSSNEIIFSSYFGGSSYEHLSDLIQIDQTIFIFGVTDSESGISTENAYQPNYNGNSDIIIASYSIESNSLLSSTYYGGSGSETSIAVNGILTHNGDIFVFGLTSSSMSIATPNAYQSNLHSVGLSTSENYDGFIAHFTPDLSSVIWATYLGNNKADLISDVTFVGDMLWAVGDSKNLSDLPLEQQASFITPNAYQTENNGSSDGFIAKFDNAVFIKENQFQSALNVHPNPTSNQCSLSLPKIGNWRVQMLNLQGDVLYSENFINQNKIVINIDNYNPGMYMIRVLGENGQIFYEKMIKE